MRPPANQYHNWRTLQPAVDDIRLQTLKREFSLTFSQARADLPNTANSDTEFMDWLSFRLRVTVDDNCGNPMDSEVPVEAVVDDEWASRLASGTRVPTLSYPIVKFLFSTVRQIQVAPSGATTMTLSYYKIPRRAVFAYTVDANDNIIYDAANSVQSELPDITGVEVCNILLGKIGVNLNDPNVQQYAAQAKQLI